MGKSLIQYRRSLLGLLLLIVGLVGSADYLFYRQPFGWTLGLYLSLLTFAFICRGGLGLTEKIVQVLALLLVGLSLALIHDPGPLVCIMALLMFFVFAISCRNQWSYSVLEWLRRILKISLVGWLCIIQDGWLLAKLLQKWLSLKLHKKRYQFKLRHFRLLYWIVPCIFGGIFLILFAIANPIISSWIESTIRNISHNIYRLFQINFVLRLLFWLVVGASLWIMFRFKMKRRIHQRSRHNKEAEGKSFLDVDIALWSLLGFNILFMLQTVLDVVYLWGGKQLPDGMSYAEYAHRGSYPLIAVALFSGFFVMLTFSPGSAAERSIGLRRLVFLWLAQNMMLTISSVWRLLIYVESYDLTRWRVAAALWMTLVTLGLIWLILRIYLHKSNGWLLRTNALTLFALLYLCCFINFDNNIAWYNVKHCAEITGEGSRIDIAYLKNLGPEALPATLWLTENTEKPGSIQKLKSIIEHNSNILYRNSDNWRAWTFQKHRLQKIIPKPTQEQNSR